MNSVIYKILRLNEWASFQLQGSFEGSPDDRRDGFIHLSARDQVFGTVKKHFSGAHDLYLLTVDAVPLGEALKWEASRNGMLFPHLYAPLPKDAIIRADIFIHDNDLEHKLLTLMQTDSP